eukprot:TRINITY_DN3712_c0_g1_i3.p1 TRINITY_DN3712_c0_g1~~TRINITY_DN3712_c0_g1_i3.p1  ORF type:complete len:631 (+),score=27.50 TRINITY_DN3712_c0_g1_i3:181-2073(+)
MEVSSVYVWLNVCRALTLVVVLVYVWSCRGAIRHLLASPLWNCKQFLPTSCDPADDALAKRIDEDFFQLRLSRFQTFMKRMMPLLTCGLLAMLAQSLLQDEMDSLWTLITIIVAVPAYIIGILVVREQSSSFRWHLDVMAIYVFATLAVRIILYRAGLSDLRYASASSYRVALQSFLTLGYLDYRKSSWANLCLCIVEIVAYSYGDTGGTDQLQQTTGQFATREVLIFFLVMLTACFSEDGARLLVRRSLEVRTSESSGRAVESILDVLCDAAVRLDSDMRLVRDSPQLGHLLLSGIGVKAGIASARCDFLQHLVEEDRSRFTEFLARQSEKASRCASNGADGAAPVAIAPNAIHISLRDSVGCAFKVQVIHAHLAGIDGDGHLLGIRDLGDSARMCATGISESQSIPEVHVAASQAPRSVGSASSSSASDASTSLRRCDLEPYTMTLTVDVFDERFPVHDVALTIQDPSRATASNSLLPLSFLLSRDSYSTVTEWLTSTVNDMAYGLPARPISDVTFASLGENATVRAGRADVRIENTDGADLFKNESCLVRLHFDEFKALTTLQPRSRVRRARKAKPTLPQIKETQSVSWSSHVPQLGFAEAQPENPHSHHQNSITGSEQTLQQTIRL